MPRRSKGPRLWLRPARRDRKGRISHAPSYFILDRGRQISTGISELPEAEQALAAYIQEKYRRQTTETLRDTSKIPIADVIAVYATDIAPNHTRPEDTKRRLARILDFFGDRTLFQINGQLCRSYARQSSTDSMARRDLEELRAAINHHRREGLHDRIVSVVLPGRRPPRERWLDRHEAAQLLWTAWRRPKCRHIAKFILIGLYTGRRASVVCSASFRRETGRAWIDLRSCMLLPPERVQITKKRNPPIPLPPRLMPHLRAWQRNGQRYAVEWSERPIARTQTIKKIAISIGLGNKVTPHVLRHTAATWQMQAGTDIFEASKFLGMTVRTLEGTYGHHRPEHLTQAKNAPTRHRQRFANGSHELNANRKPRSGGEKIDFIRG
jgi:integrase